MDVLIAGAGPVGLTLALVLHRRGVAVRVLERREGLSSASRASTFHPPTLEALDDLGVLAPLLPGGVRVDRVLWRRVDTGLSATLEFGLLREETRFPFRWHREQGDVTPALLGALCEAGTMSGRAAPPSPTLPRGGGGSGRAPDGPIRFNAGLEAITQTGSAVTARCADGSTHTARWLVGCDGASGAVRALAGIGVETNDYAHRVLRLLTPLDLRAHIPGLDGLAYLHDASGSLSLLRMPDVWRLIFRIPPEMSDEAAMDDPHARARVARFLPALRDLPVSGRDVYGVRRAMAVRYRAGRVLLAGDAAHLTNTRGGMNMNAGIHDAMTLAATLHAVLDGADDALLDRWAAARLRVVREALLPRTDARVAAPGEEVARMAAMDGAEKRAWAREAAMLDIARVGMPG